MACLLPLAGRASTSQLPIPAFVNGTSLVTFADPDEAMLHSISDGEGDVQLGRLIEGQRYGTLFEALRTPRFPCLVGRQIRDREPGAGNESPAAWRDCYSKLR